jgi:hypothetical protein
MRIKERLGRSALVGFVLVGFVSGLVLLSNTNLTEVVSADTGGGPLTAGASGFCYFMTCPHAANPATTYASNLTNASSYEHSFYLNREMDGETPYTTPFDFVLKFRVNATVGYNVTKWMDSWVRANLTVNFDFATDVGPLAAMTIVMIKNTTTYAWYHAYMNNAHAGYSLAKNEKFNCTTIKAEGYY